MRLSIMTCSEVETISVEDIVLRAAKRLNMFAVSLGGFLIFVGIIVVGVFLAGFLGIIDFASIVGEDLQSLAPLLLLAVGLLDLVAAVLLWRR